MALSYLTALRTSRMDLIDDSANAGAGAATLRIYNGTPPASANAALSGNTLLAQLTMSDPAFGAASGGVLTASAITQDSSADATGTASFFRILDSDANVVLQGTVSTSGADLNMTSTSIVITEPVSVTSLVLTEGNA